MNSSGPHASSASTGTPPADPGVSVGNACHGCAGCQFSDQSYLDVTKHQYDCSPGVTEIGTSQEVWPFDSATVDRVRWELDASNWAEYACASGNWTYAATGVDITTLPCIQSTGAGIAFGSCSQFMDRRPINSSQYVVVIEWTVKLNNCVPSVAV